MLSIHQLSCQRGHQLLFTDLNFTLGSGQALQVEGDNGAGKTSLLRMVCGLSVPHAGEIRWHDQSVQEDPEAFRGDLFYLGHQLALKEELTALENLQFDAAVSGHVLDLNQAYAALARMGLRGRERLPVRVMSQGQKRRTALARLACSSARLWVLDEPFVALDVKALDVLRHLLAEHVASGGLLLFTSHQKVALQTRAGQDIAVSLLPLGGVKK
jgi:heme exporter protein A